jgi:hypothetical protein
MKSKRKVLVEVKKPEKKKELIKFWSNITLDQLNLLSEEDYECYRRFIAKRKKV